MTDGPQGAGIPHPAPTTQPPAEAFARWTKAEREDYWRPESSEARRYQFSPRVRRYRAFEVEETPRLKGEHPPLDWRWSNRGKALKLKASEMKECRIHALRLPHAAGSKECKAIHAKRPKEEHNHSGTSLVDTRRTVRCVRCGEEWGPTV